MVPRNRMDYLIAAAAALLASPLPRPRERERKAARAGAQGGGLWRRNAAHGRVRGQ